MAQVMFALRTVWLGVLINKDGGVTKIDKLICIVVVYDQLSR